jgi:hypothetical protein
MFRIALPFAPDSHLLLTPPWSNLHPALRGGLLVLLCAVPAALVLWLYRYELRLVSRKVASVLLALRLIVLALILFLVCLQPVYARDRTEGIAGRVLVAVDRSDSMDVADPQRTPAEKLSLARALKLFGGLCTDAQLDGWIKDHESGREPKWVSDEEARDDPGRRRELEDERKRVHGQICQHVDALTRSQAARRVLDQDGINLLSTLAAKHDVELLGFNREAWEARPDRLDDLFARQQAASAEGPASAFTDLHLPLAQALAQSGPDKGKVIGVVLLTDGQHNAAESPIAKAAELGERNVPVYPIALGARKPPPDVAVLSVQAPSAAFKDVEVAVEVQFKIMGMKAQEFLIELHLADKEKKLLDRQTLRHDGKDQQYTRRFPVRLDQVGTQTLIATVKPIDPLAKETSTENNTRTATVNVADERSKVLLIDGEARWEQHYLASALQRDRSMQVRNVVFDQPRLNKELTPEELRQMGSPEQQLPAGADALADFDCIILGDVSAEQLPLADRLRLEKYVADRGGTLVILAGKRFMPLAFPDADTRGETDPLRKLLPIESPRVAAPVEGFPVTLTQQGKETKFLELEAEYGKSEARWAALPRHFWGVLGKAKPGAVSLSYLADGADKKANAEREKEQGLIVRHNYGFGRVLFVGLDSTWRWRYKTGDTYHHRFWSQTIRWAASDKPLVTGNEYVRFGTPQAVYHKGEDVQVVVRLSEELGPLKPDMLAGARLVRQGKPDEKEEAAALVPLTRREAQPRVLEGKVRDLPPGQYAIELVVPDLGDKVLSPAAAGKPREPLRANFTLLPPESREMLNLQTDWPLLEQLAAKSGGNRVFTPEDAAELVELLAKQSVPVTEHHEQRLWQWWVLLVLVVSLLTAEWVGRKWAGLP